MKEKQLERHFCHRILNVVNGEAGIPVVMQQLHPCALDRFVGTWKTSETASFEPSKASSH